MRHCPRHLREHRPANPCALQNSRFKSNEQLFNVAPNNVGANGVLKESLQGFAMLAVHFI